MPRITFLDQYSSIGGGQKILFSIMQAALAKGMQISAFLPARKELGAYIEQIYPDIDIHNIPELRLQQNRKGIMDSLLLLRHLVSFHAKYRKQLQGQDIIYVNGPRLIPHALFLARFCRTRFCYHVHLAHSGPERHLLRIAARHPSTAAMILPSHFVQTHLSTFSNAFNSPNIYILSNGLSREYDIPFEDRFTNHPLRSVVVIGRISMEKGQDALRQAAEALPQMTFHFLGDSDFSSSEYKHILQRAMPSNVCFHGKIVDIPTKVRQLKAQLCIVPSRCNEAFGLSAIEGMALSCLTLVRNKGGLKEIASQTKALTFTSDSELTTLLQQLETQNSNKILSRAHDQYTATMARYSHSLFSSRIKDMLNQVLSRSQSLG